MKKHLLLIATLGLYSLNASGQWITQASGFSAASRGILNFSIVNSTSAWAVAYDGSGGGAAVQDFTKTTNGGTTWTPGIVSPAAGLVNSSLFALDMNTAWIVFYDGANGGGKMYKTTDGGTNWSQQTTAAFAAPDGFPNLVYFWDANNGVCMGDPNGGYFEIYTTTNGGTNWIRTPTGNIPVPLTGEWGYNGAAFSVSGNNIWFITNKGRVYKSVDKGLNWTVSVSGYPNLGSISFKDATTGVVADTVSAATTIRATINGGTNWTLITPVSGKIYANSIRYVPGTTSTLISTGAVIGRSGSSYSLDGGQNWITIDDGIQHTSLAFLDATTGYSGGFNTNATTGGIFKWSGVFNGIKEAESSPVPFVFPNPSKGAFFVGAKASMNEEIKIRVYDAMGRIVFSTSEKADNANYRRHIDLAGSAAGLYIVEIEKNNTPVRHKMIIK